MSDEFYVGYLPTAPVGLARRVRRAVIGAALLAGLAAASLAASQVARAPGLFEFGTYRDFEGILFETPLPMLRMTAEGSDGRLLLVGFGKAGLPDFARGHHGQRVRFRGSLVVQGKLSMIEMNDPESFEVLDPSPSRPSERAQVLGAVTLTGELVDTKCYFGVMRPATGKVHRACAIRCLSGGVPPGLLVRDGTGGATVFLLAGGEGEPLQFDLEWAALEVTATGSLELHGELPVVRVQRLELER